MHRTRPPSSTLRLLLSMLAAISWCIAPNASKADSVTLDYRTIVLTGDPVPGHEEEGATFRWIGGAPNTSNVACLIDSEGNVGFTAGWGTNVFGPHGVLRDTQGVVEVLAERGGSAPGVPTTFDFFPGLALLAPRVDAGRSSFDALVTVDGTQRGGIWTDRAGPLELAVFQTDHPPGSPPGYFFFQWSHTLRNGEIVLNGAWGGGLNEQGFWRERGAGLEAIVLAGEVAPGTDGAIFGNGTELAFPAFQAWDLDDDARIVFHGMLQVPSELNDEGVWVEQESGIALLAREGDPAPGDAGARYLGNAGFRTFGHDNGIDIFRSGSGHVLFGAQTDVAGNSYPGSGIYTDRSGTVERVALARPAAESPPADHAPGFPPGVTFSQFLNASITDAGHVFLNAFTTSGAFGIWSDAGGELVRLLATGDTDGLPAGWSIEIPVLLRAVDPGFVLVSATFTTPDGSSRGVLLVGPDGDIGLVAASGLGHEVRPGDIRTIGEVITSSQMGGGGEVACELRFTDGSEALVVARPAETASVEPQIASELVMAEVSPNPFRETTLIRIALLRSAQVDLGIYDANGREVRSLLRGWQPSGELVTHWDGYDTAGKAVAPGVYFVRMGSAGAFAGSRKVTLLR